MSAIVGALRAVLSLESAAFTSGLKEASAGLKRFQADTARIGKSMQKIGAVVSLAGAGIAAGIRAQLNLADDMGKAAQKFGVPIEELSKINYAAGLAGVSLDTLGTGLRKLSQNMAAVEGGNKAAVKLFGDMGVSVVDASGKLRSTEAVFQDVADVLAGMPDGAEKTALAMAVFGKSGTELIPLLNAGKAGLKDMAAEAEALGIVITAKTAKGAENFNDNLSRLQTAAQGLFMQIAAELAPALEQMSLAAIELVKSFGQLSPGMRAFIAGAAAIVVISGPMIVGLGLAVSAVGSLAGAFAALGTVLMAHPLIALSTVLAAGAVWVWYNWDWVSTKIVEAWDWIKSSVTGAWEAIKTACNDAWELVKTTTSTAWEAIKTTITGALDAAIAKVQGLIQWFRDAWQAAKDIGQSIADAITGADNLKTRMAADRATWVEYGRQAAAGMAEGVGAGMAENEAELREYFAQPAEMARDELQIKSPSRVMRTIGQQAADGLSLGLKDGIPGLKDAMAGIGDALNESGGSLESRLASVQDAFRSAFTSAVTGAMSAKEAVGQLADRLAQMLADQAFDMLFGQMFSGGGWLASIFGFANGGVFSGGRVTPFATGGIVGGPTAFAMPTGLGVMGEAGPEAIMPLTRGPGGRLGVQAHGGGTTRIVIEENPMFASRVEAISGQSAVSVVRQYDAEMAPVSRRRNAREIG